VSARDGAADREPESGTGHGALLAAALELLERKLRIARRESPPPVLDHHPDEALVDGSADGDLCTRRCVLGDVVEEVAEELHRQAGVDVHRRQVGREGELHGVILQPLLEPVQRRKRGPS
jgi:hypothetical protein